MAGEKNFKVRLSVEGAEQMMAAFRSAAGQSEEMRKAFDALVQSSPTLASSLDRAGAAAADTAKKMKDGGARSADDLTAALKRTSEAARETGTSSLSLSSIVQGAAAGKSAMAAAALAAAAALGAAGKATATAGDSLKMLEARLLSSSGSAVLAAANYEKLVSIAKLTGGTMEDTASAFQRFSVAARDIGANSDQVLKLVSGIQGFAVLSGTGPQQAAAATQQLAQALASGKFQGDELRSVMENMPELAEALAKQLGVGTGQLRQMGSEGKLTADIVFPALLAAVDGVNTRMEAMPKTVARAWNALQVESDRFLGSLDRVLGISDRIAARFQTIADLVSSMRQGFAATPLEAAQNQLRTTEASIESLSAQNASPSMFSGTITRKLEAARAQAEALRNEIARLQAEGNYAAAVDDEKAADRRRQSTARSLDEIDREYRTHYDKRFKATEEYNARLEAIERRRLGGRISDEAAMAERADALNDYNEALKKTAGTTKEAADYNQILAEAMDRVRGKRDESFASIEASLDPYTAALKRQADALKILADAETAYATSGGEKGINPGRVAELRGMANERFDKDVKNIGKSADDTGRAFDQFFSRATSGFEDAIVKGKSFGDVLKGLEGDILRLILRITVLDPLSKSLSGAFSGASGGGLFSGVGGAISSGFSWLTGLFGFADGGVMTSAGPLHLNRYAGGGVANSPQVAMFGEGDDAEAYVPLPDGRSIPVTMRGGGAMSITHAPVYHVNASGMSSAQALALIEAAAQRANEKLFAAINRGGGVAKMVGRRR